jgi:hypothetical protein
MRVTLIYTNTEVNSTNTHIEQKEYDIRKRKRGSLISQTQLTNKKGGENEES